MTDSTNDSKKGENIFEVLDELIFHMNTTKNIFMLLIISAFILAPLAFIFAGIVIFHPRFIHVLMNRMPDIASMILAYIVISVILASIWLFIGIKEQRFFSKWNSRFRRFISLKNQIEKELDED